MYGIICSLKRHLEERNGSEALNPLDASDNRYLTTVKSNCSEFITNCFRNLYFFCYFSKVSSIQKLFGCKNEKWRS